MKTKELIDENEGLKVQMRALQDAVNELQKISRMTKEEFITRRTEIISNMLDNPDKHGIYPTTKCFEQLDKLFDELQSKLEDCDEIKEQLESALEYWNQDRNDKAMFDALENYEKVIDSILTSKTK